MDRKEHNRTKTTFFGNGRFDICNWCVLGNVRKANRFFQSAGRTWLIGV